MVYSVVGQQHYDNWELILVNASSESKYKKLAQRCAEIDTRVKVIEVAGNLGIAGNTDLGIKNASGEYVALLDHDDTLSPRALYEVVKSIQTKPRAQLIYSDEDKITEDGRRAT